MIQKRSFNTCTTDHISYNWGKFKQDLKQTDENTCNIYMHSANFQSYSVIHEIVTSISLSVSLQNGRFLIIKLNHLVRWQQLFLLSPHPRQNYWNRRDHMSACPFVHVPGFVQRIFSELLNQ